MKLSMTGCLLAGGKSTRFGQPKAAFPYRGVPMASRVETTLLEVCKQVRCVGDPTPWRPNPAVAIWRDLEPDRGPVFALHQALRLSPLPWIYASACDLPLLQPAFVRTMGEIALERNPGAVVIVPRHTDGRIEPLMACYCRSFREWIQSDDYEGGLHRMLLGREKSEHGRVHFVEEEELAALGIDLSANATNINRLIDLPPNDGPSGAESP